MSCRASEQTAVGLGDHAPRALRLGSAEAPLSPARPVALGRVSPNARSVPLVSLRRLDLIEDSSPDNHLESRPGGALWEVFAQEGRRLGEDFDRASALGRGSPQEIADHREGVFRQLVGRFFPAPHHVVKGQVVGADGSRSASVDCAVLNPAHPHLVDADRKFSLILADAVDFVVEVKGRLDRAELSRLLMQCRSVRQVVRSQTAIAFPRFHRELVEPSRRIPFFAYIHEMSMTPDNLAEQVRHWVDEFKVPPLERPEMIIVRDQGVYHDLSSAAAALSRRALQRGPDQWALLQGHQLWSDARSLALGFGILMMNEVLPAVPVIGTPPVLLNYREAFTPPTRDLGHHSAWGEAVT